jgi:hypothetical protein
MSPPGVEDAATVVGREHLQDVVLDAVAGGVVGIGDSQAAGVVLGESLDGREPEFDKLIPFVVAGPVEVVRQQLLPLPERSYWAFRQEVSALVGSTAVDCVTGAAPCARGCRGPLPVPVSPCPGNTRVEKKKAARSDQEKASERPRCFGIGPLPAVSPNLVQVVGLVSSAWPDAIAAECGAHSRDKRFAEQAG